MKKNDITHRCTFYICMICNKPLIHSKKWYVADTVEAWKSQKITLIRPVKFIVCTVQQSINGMEMSPVFGASELVRVLFFFTI